ncbi:MAG: glycosyltransferase family 39 protein, partial [Chlorobiales bacterium]|nr:glycosyltransferase family 39 protein [Chlorobiales bacterium]
LLIALVRLGSLGLYPLVDPTEGRYAEMGRKMLETGNWITPLFDYGVPYWGKPPLSIWLTASSLAVEGINEFSARLPFFLLGAAIGWIVYYLGKSQRSENNGLASLVILSSTSLFFLASGSVTMDQSMTLGTTLALGAFWLALHSERPVFGYLFFIGLAIGVMAKGPVAVVLCGIPITLWIAIRGEWTALWKRLPWIKGTLLFLALSVPWYVLAEQKTPGFLEYYFIGEHWKRFTESGWQGDLYGRGRAHPRGTIWLFWLLASLPWSLIFLGRMSSSLKAKIVKSQFQSIDGWRLYCLLWMLSPMLFFTLSANITWAYVLPGLPGFALLLADWLQGDADFSHEKRKTIFGIATSLLIPVTLLFMVFALRLFPSLELLPTQKPLVEAYLNARSSPEEHLRYVEDWPFTAQFYSEGKSQKLARTDDIQKELASSNGDFFVLKHNTFDRIPEQVKNRLEVIKTYGNFVLLRPIRQSR